MLKKNFALVLLLALFIGVGTTKGFAQKKGEDLHAYALFNTSTSNWHLDGASQKVEEKKFDQKAFALYNTSTTHWGIEDIGHVARSREINNRVFSLNKSGRAGR